MRKGGSHSGMSGCRLFEIFPPLLQARVRHDRHWLCKQVIHQDLPLNHAAVLAVGDTECRHHCQMNGLLGTERFFERLNTDLQFFRFISVNRVWRADKLHLAEVHYFVGPHNQQVYLCTCVFAVALYSPCGNGGFVPRCRTACMGHSAG